MAKYGKARNYDEAMALGALDRDLLLDSRYIQVQEEPGASTDRGLAPDPVLHVTNAATAERPKVPNGNDVAVQTSVGELMRLAWKPSCVFLEKSAQED